MRKTLALAAVLLAACEAQVQTDADGLRVALPDEAAIRIASPAPEPAPAATAEEVIAAAPAFGSEYARTTFWSAATVNAGVAWSLARLRLVVSLAPTSCDELSCTWGPFSDREELNVWRLVARHEGAGYAFALDGRPGSRPFAPFAPIVAGSVYPGRQTGRGYGSFKVDFEAAAALDHPEGWRQEDFGRVEVAYDARQALRVDVTALGARSRDPEAPVSFDAVYAYRAGAEGGGELQLVVETLEATETLAAGSLHSLRSRWDVSGAGRGDAVTPAGAASECWSGAADGFALVYGSEPLAGDEGACAFAPALPASLALP